MAFVLFFKYYNKQHHTMKKLVYEVPDRSRAEFGMPDLQWFRNFEVN